MRVPETAVEGIVRWGAIAAPAVVALVLIAGRLLFWTGHFLGRAARGATGRGGQREALAASSAGAVLLEMAASLAAAAGLVATFLDLRSGAGGMTPAEAGRLSPVFAPALVGLGVYVFCQGTLGIFRAWSEGLRTETLLAAPPDPIRPRDGAAASRRPRRSAPSPAPLSGRETVRNAAVVVACMIGSILLHSAVFFVAHRVQTAPVPAREPERAGVFAARLVSLPREPARPPEEVREEPVPPPLKEPPPPEAPKAETPEAAPPTERPKVEPPAEKPKPEAPPSGPPTLAEAKEPEPEPRGKAAEPPAAKVTESSTAAKETAAPAAVDPSPPAPVPSSPKPGAEPAVLGFGDSGKAREKEAASAGVSTLKEYRQFLAREMKSGAPEGQYVPNLRFGDNKAQENREIMRYFGMELIAYPKDQKFYVYIDPDQGLYSRSNDFAFIRKFSSRAIFRTSPYFDGLRAEAARRVDVSAESLVVAQLLKPSSAAYIGWKEAECARRAGVALDAVDACDARFMKSPFGVWIVRIDRLLLKDGRTLEVEDFEWAKVSVAGGGER